MPGDSAGLRSRLLRAAAALAIVTAIAVLVQAVMEYRDKWLPVKDVQIQGAFVNVSRDAVRKQVVDQIDGGYLTVDLHRIREALLALPWIEDASIRRQWPATLEIRVHERQAVAYWGRDSLLSATGKLFSPSRIDEAGPLPRLAGPDGQHLHVWQQLQQLLPTFAELGFAVDRLAMDARHSWSMQLSGADFSGLEVQVGRSDVQERITRFVKVFSMKNAPRLGDAAYLDLRYPNGFAMRMKTLEPESGAGGEGRLNVTLVNSRRVEEA